ncbi:MAG: PadR family transcriptional regulator [Chitinophagaceae bacterium]
MKNYNLGEFEELVLLVVAGLAGEGYGVNIQETLLTHSTKNISLSAVHVALKRLSDKGFVKSSVGGITEERGGRRKKYYTVTAMGRKAIDAQYVIRNLLYSQIPKLNFGR